MRSKTNAILVVLSLAGCAGGDGLGSSVTQSPFYGPVGEAGGDADTHGDTAGDSGTEDGGGGPIPGDPDPADPSATDPAPDDPSAADDGGGGGQPPPQPPVGGDCCTPAGAPGCANDPNVEMCVCQIDDFCCTQQWDETCVSIVGECADACPGAEPPPEGGTDGGGSDGGGAMGGDCCAPTGAPGCADPEIANCVCQIDDFCCFVEWDDVCAEIATECGC